MTLVQTSFLSIANTLLLRTSDCSVCTDATTSGECSTCGKANRSSSNGKTDSKPDGNSSSSKSNPAKSNGKASGGGCNPRAAAPVLAPVLAPTIAPTIAHAGAVLSVGGAAGGADAAKLHAEKAACAMTAGDNKQTATDKTGKGEAGSEAEKGKKVHQIIQMKAQMKGLKAFPASSEQEKVCAP